MDHWKEPQSLGAAQRSGYASPTIETDQSGRVVQYQPSPPKAPPAKAPLAGGEWITGTLRAKIPSFALGAALGFAACYCWQKRIVRIG